MGRLLKISPRKVFVAASQPPETCIRGIARHSRKHDWHLVTDMIFAGAQLGDWTGDGLIVLGAVSREFSDGVRNMNFPCVVVNGPACEASFPRVEPDHEEIGRLAAEHLLRRAHRSFACAPAADDFANRARFQSFAHRLSAQGRSCRLLPSPQRENTPPRPGTWAERRRLLVADLKRLPLPAAVFAFDDCVAADVVDACRDAGLSVPDDVSVLGVGNSLAAETSSVPLSSIDDNTEEAGRSAAALLGRLMNGAAAPDGPVRIRPRGVVTRQSTDAVAVADRRVSRALGYIAEHYPDPMLSVNRVANATGMSRRNLERSFREQAGCTVNEHIIGVRMREASRILRTHPRTRSAEVALLVGIAGPGTFFRTFRRFFGTSPRDHRDRDALPPEDRPQAA